MLRSDCNSAVNRHLKCLGNAQIRDLKQKLEHMMLVELEEASYGTNVLYLSQAYRIIREM